MANNTQTGVITEEKWLQLWNATNGKPCWCRDSVDQYLQKYMSCLTGDKQDLSILVPWCGKSLDLLWLEEQGHTVVGVELIEFAVDLFFRENSIAFSVSEKSGFKVYTATERRITIYCGNMYNFTPGIAECTFDAIWNHHALGSTNPADRIKHIDVLRSVLKPQGTILLSHFEYDPTQYPGPPFSLSPAMIQELFREHFSVELLERPDVTDTQTPRNIGLTWAKRPIHILQLMHDDAI